MCLRPQIGISNIRISDRSYGRDVPSDIINLPQSSFSLVWRDAIDDIIVVPICGLKEDMSMYVYIYAFT